jgi:hypothetical protein
VERNPVGMSDLVSAESDFGATSPVKGKVMGDHRGGAKGDHFFT